MKRAHVVISVVGLALAAASARADIPKEVELFGQKYNVTVQSRAGTFKNGVTITVQSEGEGETTTQKANLSFVEGADASADRLFVVAPIGRDVTGPTGHQFYMLKGAEASGLFTTSSAEATPFFGGKVDNLVGGRPQNVVWLSDTDTGVQKDRNIALWTFTGNDRLMFYDLDTLKGTFEDDVVHLIGIGEDENMPSGSWEAITRAPNGFLVAVADSGGIWEMGVMDPAKDAFFDVKTDLVEAIGTSGKELEHVDRVHALARYGEEEYWILSSVGDPGGDNNDALGEQYLTRLKITFPADFNAGAGSIKAELLGQEEIFSKNLHQSDGGLFGLAIGRELAPGRRVVYFTDWVGNLLTLTPVLPAAGP